MSDSPLTSDAHPASQAGTLILNARPVPRMGYGTMGLASAVSASRTTHADAIALLQRAADLGVRAFDTAQFYNRGTANDLLREAFADRRDEICHLSKVGAREPDRGPLPLVAAQRPEELRRQIEENLRSLGADHIEVVHLRRMDQMPGLIAIKPSQRVSLDDQLAELVRLRDAGIIGGIGLSNVSLAQLRQALPVGVSSVSNSYNLLRRTDEDLLQLCEREHIAWAPFFPLGGAMLKRFTAVSRDPVVQDAARELGATPSQIGLAWLLAHSPQSLVIAGTTSIAHLDQNVGAAGVHLPPEVLARLDAAQRSLRPHPHRSPANSG